MATRYIDDQKGTYGVVETLEDRLEEENNGLWKARWTNIREGKKEGGKRCEATGEVARPSRPVGHQ